LQTGFNPDFSMTDGSKTALQSALPAAVSFAWRLQQRQAFLLLIYQPTVSAELPSINATICGHFPHFQTSPQTAQICSF